MTGAVLFAIGLWQVMVDDQPPDSLRRAVRILVLAEAFAYNRLLPSLSWEPAETIAEQRLPGGIAEARAENGGRSAVELRTDAERLVAELDR